MGDVKSQMTLARSLLAGDGVPKSSTKACKWFERAGEGGSVEGMIETARCYSGDRGIPTDFNRATEWWQKAADKGNAEAQYELGTSKVAVGKEGAIIWATGDEAKKISDSFLQWETRAADQGYAQAIAALGMTYLLGGSSGETNERLIQPDIEKGVAFIRRAADSGYWYGQWAVAALYQVGFKTIQPDKEVSDRYWKLLDAQASAEAERGIGNLFYEYSSKNYIPGKNKYLGRVLSYSETNNVAREWYEKAAAQNDAASIYQLGLMYRDGIGFGQDAGRADEYFKRCADLGQFRCMDALAFAYSQGSGVVRDYSEAFKWFLAAANENEAVPWSRVHQMRSSVGFMYENGYGTEKDLILAYAWYNVAAASGYAEAKKSLSRMESQLTPDQLKEAQALSSHWSPGQVMRTTLQLAKSDASNSVVNIDTTGQVKPTRQSVGSGFFISEDGYILTNNHVVGGCTELHVPSENKVAKTVVADTQNDLAVIKIDISSKRILMFSKGDAIWQGENVYVFGFPLEGFLPTAGNFTPGMVAALAGPGNNASLVQITAPVQPGNSGGPVLDGKGHVVGIVVGKADAVKIANATGDIPQNINFAIAPQTIQAFLEGNRIAFSRDNAWFSFNKNTVEIAELARESTVKVECWR
jgi:TPR repeat protein